MRNLLFSTFDKIRKLIKQVDQIQLNSLNFYLLKNYREKPKTQRENLNQKRSYLPQIFGAF